jgi:hypothetical protein
MAQALRQDGCSVDDIVFFHMGIVPLKEANYFEGGETCMHMPTATASGPLKLPWLCCLWQSSLLSRKAPSGQSHSKWKTFKMY